MAEDGIPEILAEQRLGHEVPGIRGLYAHASNRIRDELKVALQARWEDSLRARAAISPRSPVPLLDKILGQLGDSAAPKATVHDLSARGGGEKMISQFLPDMPKVSSRT